MASKRQRKNGTWEFTVKNSKYLGKRIWLTFDSEEEGDEYCRRLETLLKNGIVPTEFRETHDLNLLRDVIRDYCANAEITEGDRNNLNVVRGRVGNTFIHSVNLAWAENWISQMKVEHNVSPSTIKKHVGALARCLDWAMARNLISLTANPLRKLGKKYATYGRKDVVLISQMEGKVIKSDVSRDRRFKANEEDRVRKVLNREVISPGESVLKLPFQLALNFMFEMALETAMRMREIYTLRVDQIDLKLRTIHLEKSKNGDTREVPMSSVIIAKFKDYMEAVKSDHPTMGGWQFDNGYLFPWIKTLDPKVLKLTSASLSKQFNRIFDRAKVEDFRFHDLRHEATSRLFERTKMDSVEIAKITGHKDPKMLMIYTNLRGSNLAAKLW